MYFYRRNAFELLPSDMLLIILLVRTRFPVHQKLEDFFSQSVALEDKPIQPPSIPENELYQSATEEHDLNESEENEEVCMIHVLFMIHDTCFPIIRSPPVE